LIDCNKLANLYSTESTERNVTEWRTYSIHAESIERSVMNS